MCIKLDKKGILALKTLQWLLNKIFELSQNIFVLVYRFRTTREMEGKKKKTLFAAALKL